MAVRKVNGHWRADFQIDHRRIRKNSPDNTKESALLLESRLRREIAIHGKLVTHEPAKREARSITLKEFFPRWMSGYVVSNNRKKEQALKTSVFKKHILPFFGEKQLLDVTSEDVEKYKGKKLEAGLACKSINNHLVVLHKAFSTAKEWGLIESIPRMKQLKLTEPPFSYLTRDQVSALLKTAKGILRNMLLIALRTGARYSELTALQWEDVDWVTPQITIRRSQVEGVIGNTKNNRIRRVPLTEDAFSLLGELKQQQGLIFQENGTYVVYETSRRRLKRCCEEAGTPVVSWHALRHTFASHLVASGAALLAVKQLMGHSDIKMTMRYSHLGTNELRDTIKLLC